MHSYVVEYLNENEFKKIERSLKKYNMLAYKKLIFDYVPSLRDGNFQGVVVSKNSKEGIVKYELKLPTDRMFSKVHGDIVLHYTLYVLVTYSSITSATFLDNLTASTTVFAPVTTSPEANIPSLLVLPYSSVVRSPLLLTSIPFVDETIFVLGPCPTAIIIESVGISSSVPSIA